MLKLILVIVNEPVIAHAHNLLGFAHRGIKAVGFKLSSLGKFVDMRYVGGCGCD